MEDMVSKSGPVGVVAQNSTLVALLVVHEVFEVRGLVAGGKQGVIVGGTGWSLQWEGRWWLLDPLIVPAVSAISCLSSKNTVKYLSSVATASFTDSSSKTMFLKATTSVRSAQSQ